MPDFKLSPSY